MKPNSADSSFFYFFETLYPFLISFSIEIFHKSKKNIYIYWKNGCSKSESRVLIKIKSIKQGLLAVIRYHQDQHFGMHPESPQLYYCYEKLISERLDLRPRGCSLAMNKGGILFKYYDTIIRQVLNFVGKV